MTTEPAVPAQPGSTGHDEPAGQTVGSRLNWLRAGVLGANDGIVSVAGIILGVAGATDDLPAIVTAGIAGLAAGALSMAVGEYVSVSTQRDTERAMVAAEIRELREQPEAELDELTDNYQARGLPYELAREVAVTLTERDALAAHAQVELRFDPDELTNPWHAAFASLVAFIVGAVVPLLAVSLPAPSLRVTVTVAAVVLALAGSGLLAGRLGHAPVRRPMLRNILGGCVAMAVTYAIGSVVGVAV